MKNIRKKKIYHILFWSVISAAFIGPGTVTTALKAGSLYNTDLLWAIVYSIIACYVLQEASSRITIATGFSLSEAIAQKFGNKQIFNVNNLLVIAVIFGCVAYQAGNMVGALQGIRLLINIPTGFIILSIYIIAGLILWNGKIHLISRILGMLVGLMAVIFIILCWQIEFDLKTLVQGLLFPRFPEASSIYILGLIGTTIVPYNLFLGSGISHNQNLEDTRFGLANAIIIGGLITIFILLSGTLITGVFSFENIASMFQNKLGRGAGIGFAIGLFSAGLTSSITAPLAAAVTSKSIISSFCKNDKQLNTYFRNIWIGVLTLGGLFSIIDFQPVALIVMAQAINGLILPFVAYYLYIILNDHTTMPEKFINNKLYNFIMLLVIAITIFLGLYHFVQVIFNLINFDVPMIWNMMLVGLVSVVLIIKLIIFTIRLDRLD